MRWVGEYRKECLMVSVRNKQQPCNLTEQHKHKQAFVRHMCKSGNQIHESKTLKNKKEYVWNELLVQL